MTLYEKIKGLDEEQLFEIERALDLLPHIAGGSWAMIWFRMKGIRNPTRWRDTIAVWKLYLCAGYIPRHNLIAMGSREK